MRSLDHFNVKIFAQPAPQFDLAQAVPVFHRWIQESARPELLIDVADYRHVQAGPGVLLVGHEANYSLDNRAARLGLLYNRKLASEDSLPAKLEQAFGAALGACAALEAEPAFGGKLRFNAGEAEILINDRLLAPNTAAAVASLLPELRAFLDHLYGVSAYTAESGGAPGERLCVAVKTAEQRPVAWALERLRRA